MSKNEDAWRALFENHSILKIVDETGSFTISSDQINKFRESRLMTKFDHHANLPDIFKKNGLAILPVTRGSYVIGRFHAYQAQFYDKDIEEQEFEFPAQIESLSPTNIYSESAAINCAFVSGMIDEIAGESTLPTLSGRMGTSKFRFKIRSDFGNKVQHFSVDNSQCEIDGGFEGNSTLVIVEAKNAISEDFIIRQLYYPFRLWHERVAKKIIPVFLSYSNDMFHFFVYDFEDVEDYNSIKLVHQKNYTIAPERIEIEDILSLFEKISILEEPEEPFPQADSFERVVDLLTLLRNGVVDGSSITENYDFDPRQTLYYTSACRYLGLIEGGAGAYTLTKFAETISRLGYKAKYLSLVKAILAHGVFNKTFRLYLENGQRPPKDSVIQIMKSSRLRNVGSDSTYRRRAQTVLSWVDWILGLQS